MNGKLWPLVAGSYSEWLAPDSLAQFRVVEELGCGDADRRQVVEKAQFGQLSDAVWEDVDPNSQLTNCRGGLVDIHVDQAGVDQRQRQSHSANTASHDRDFHSTLPSRGSTGCRSERHRT